MVGFIVVVIWVDAFGCVTVLTWIVSQAEGVTRFFGVFFRFGPRLAVGNGIGMREVLLVLLKFLRTISGVEGRSLSEGCDC